MTKVTLFALQSCEKQLGGKTTTPTNWVFSNGQKKKDWAGRGKQNESQARSGFACRMAENGGVLLSIKKCGKRTLKIVQLDNK